MNILFSQGYLSFLLLILYLYNVLPPLAQSLGSNVSGKLTLAINSTL